MAVGLLIVVTVMLASLGRDQWTLRIYFPDRADSVHGGEMPGRETDDSQAMPNI